MKNGKQDKNEQIKPNNEQDSGLNMKNGKQDKNEQIIKPNNEQDSVIEEQELTIESIKGLSQEKLINQKDKVFELLKKPENKELAVELLTKQENNDFAVEFFTENNEFAVEFLKDPKNNDFAVEFFTENNDFAVEFLKEPENNDFAVEFFTKNNDFAVEFLAKNPATTSVLIKSGRPDELPAMGNALNAVDPINNEEAIQKLNEYQENQNNPIAHFIKQNLQNFSNKFFVTNNFTAERKNLLQEILKIPQIQLANIKPQEVEEGKAKKNFIDTFLNLFNDDNTKLGEVIKKHLNDFTEDLLATQNFQDKHIKLFADAIEDVKKKIFTAINTGEEQAQAKTNATKIALESTNVSILEKALETPNINTKIKIEKETKLSEAVAKKLSELAVSVANDDQKANAKALITNGITAENKTIVENLTADAIINLEPAGIKLLTKKAGEEANFSLKLLENINIDDLSNNPKTESLARKIAHESKTVLEKDKEDTKNLISTLGIKKESFFDKIKISSDSKAISKHQKDNYLTLTPEDQQITNKRKELAREEVTENNKNIIKSLQIGLIHALKKHDNNANLDSLKSAIKVASGLSGKDHDFTNKSVEIASVDLNRDRLKLFGLHRKIQGEEFSGFSLIDNNNNKETFLKQFKSLDSVGSQYDKDVFKKDGDRYIVKLAFIEFMGYKTQQELSLLKTVGGKSIYDKAKIDTIIKEIKDNFGWTLETGNSNFGKNKPMKLEYKRPIEKTKIYKEFHKETKALYEIAQQVQQAQQEQPDTNLKNSLQVSKLKKIDLDILK